jgi:hypothetical protein
MRFRIHFIGKAKQMTKEQELNLAKYLRELEAKLRHPDDWCTWVRGSLIGVAEMLELINENRN